jgi:thiamine biosynthesis lipoprotein
MNAAQTLGREYERRVDVFGSRARILAGPPVDDQGEVALAALSGEALLRHQQRLLSRFETDSELSLLNASEEETVVVSPTLLAFLLAARWAHERSGGLVDATVACAVEAAGYAASMPSPEIAVSLAQALAVAPDRRPAVPRQPSPWDAIAIDTEGLTVRRPVGLAFDSGGITKGHAADLVAAALAGFSSFAVDCGGDIRLGGVAALERVVEVTDPFDGEVATSFGLTSGAVATSGINRRIWSDGNRFAHHVIDPGRGEPAWTGLVQATAVAPTALEAEVLAKAALLSGQDRAARWLGRWGGLVFADDGARTDFGPVRPAQRERVAAA